MKKYYYAYHGPNNDSDFDALGGYGVSKEYKQKQTKVGDLVYVIQKRPERKYYELCGIYEIAEHYYQKSSKKPYRLRLLEKNLKQQRIVIDEAKCSKNLPLLNGDERLSNFQKHFCRQGVSLQSPLEPQIVAVLDKLLHQDSVGVAPPIEDFTAFEAEFSKQLSKAMRSSSAERLQRLLKANKVPSSKMVSAKVFKRNADVVAETLYRARGVCGKCGNKAPFTRRSDGLAYLEVHHKVQLANGGEDSLDNAIALCPNCHRELHFGVSPS